MRDMSETALELPARDADHERVIAIVLDMPPQQARLVSLLSRGAVATTKQIRDYLESKTHPKIAISHARSKLRAMGLDIKSKYHIGYWMDEADRERIDALVKEFIGGR